MKSHSPVFRASSTDFDQTTEMRRLVQEAREVLKRPLPDTFLGRKTFEPFPQESKREPEDL